ncbi:hypothetical protein EXIGLDRAFT_722156 [Exidia glandulosa HHB12029]|uniref:Uncharacterized protein n=1 Tax=Exidia glandulosa HHB12029 TaxID=1314781 RepID=A0A165FFG0_EXIGL|nr:hypothetical protein EXIGLDRAFT_722156 [Exidia glandulosa HHB12029]
MSANVTVDDSDSSIIYSAGWQVQGCPGCKAVPSPTEMLQVYGGTYHDATVNPDGEPVNAVFSFNGTAVYVYGWSASSSTVAPEVANQDMTFLLDLEDKGDFKRNARPENDFSVLYFKQENLAPGSHTLTMISNPGSLALLDYIVFTEVPGEDTLQTHRESSNPLEASPSSSPSLAGLPPTSDTDAINAATGTGTENVSQPSGSPGAQTQQSGSVSSGVVAGILIPLFLLIVGAVAFILWRRRRRQQRAKAANMSSRTFLIDDEPDMIYAPNAPGAPLSRYGTASPVPHTPTFARPFLDPGTSAYYDPREVPLGPPLILAPPPAARSSPLRVNTALYSPVQRVPTPREMPLPLGPPTEISEQTYPDTIDVPVAAPPPLPPIPPQAPSPVLASPVSRGRQSMRRLVVYNAPSDISASDENGGAPTSGGPVRRRPSPPPPVPTVRR